MAKAEINVVRLDKRSLDAINALRKAIDTQNQIARKSQKSDEEKSGVRLSEGEGARHDGPPRPSTTHPYPHVSIEPDHRKTEVVTTPGLARGGYVSQATGAAAGAHGLGGEDES